jgi:DNA (cytosine-5)-methyltransferase 1
MIHDPAGDLTTVELFCGIGGFRLAADRLGLRTVWANDLSDLACPVYRTRFGDAVLHQGDINALLDTVPDHDLLTAGFPCQPFSAAGKKEGTRDPRGTLFQAIVDVLQRSQPRYFVLENVKRLLSMEHGAHFATVLSALSGLDYLVEWRVLNAKDFGLAQNRERVVIVGTRLDQLGDEPAGVSRAVCLATRADLRSSGRGLAESIDDDRAWKDLDVHGARFPIWGLALRKRFVAANLTSFSAALPRRTLREILETNPAEAHDFTEETKARLHMNEAVNKFVQGVEILSNQGGGARMGYTIFGIGGLSPTLTASTSRHYERYRIGDRYRRLTPVEYARLQGFPDDHCLSSPKNQYILFGNAVPPPVAEWAIGRVLRRGRPGESAAERVDRQVELSDV